MVNLDQVAGYPYGARWSCTGYFYYDSIPGGHLCVLNASNSQFIEVHNGGN